MNNFAAYMASIQQAFTNVNSSIAGVQSRLKALEEGSGLAVAPETTSTNELRELRDLIQSLEARFTQFESVVDNKIKQAITVVLEGLASAASSVPEPPATTETLSVDVVGGTLNLDDGLATPAAPATAKKAVTRKAKTTAA